MPVRLLVCAVVLSAVAFGQSAPTAHGAAHCPVLIRADLPTYPPLAWTAHVTGTVQIAVTVEQGAVVDAHVQGASSPFLSLPSLENVKTWRFDPEPRTTFVVAFVYRIAGKETLLPENPEIVVDLPRSVRITAKYLAQQMMFRQPALLWVTESGIWGQARTGICTTGCDSPITTTDCSRKRRGTCS
jgi:hypothetical protein